MTKWLLAAGVLLVSSALVMPDAEARRFGGGRSIGVQRNVQSAPPARPAQQQQTAQPQQGAPAQGAPAAAGSKWGPILGGLALGGLLGWLFAGNGLGGVLLLALLAIAAVLAFRALARRRETPQQVQYAGLGRDTVYAPPPGQASAPVRASGRVPAGFDAEGFLRAAKKNFARLQVANDLGELESIRDFTTDEMFEEVRKDFAERGAAQRTDVTSLDAELLELATEGDKHWVSVRFSGMVREAPGTAPVGFQEVWNLVKPSDGSSGWLLAGIQQMH
ncbi:MAG TPA: Tim44-like domain-containing protein [Burkholderiales bacterium]|jgi:predicted lipid-binding transport protein (Tim44 family)|nr:Tim44-like domain-containing protein [Burkholderiales bacterium]